MAAEKERLVLLNRARHAPKLRDDVTSDTPNGYVLKWDQSSLSWYPSADSEGAVGSVVGTANQITANNVGGVVTVGLDPSIETQSMSLSGNLAVSGKQVAGYTIPGDYPYAVGAADYIVTVNTADSAKSITLPNAATAGSGRIIHVVDQLPGGGGAGVNKITINASDPTGSGGIGIAGANSKTIETNGGYLCLVSNGLSTGSGGGWLIISAKLNDYAFLEIENDLSGQVDGDQTIFNTTQSYKAGSLVVYFNGMRQRTGSGKEVVETTSSSFTTYFGEAPPVGSVVVAVYEPL
jgi:hypothetical protein